MSITSRKQGFTLIEMIVSLGLFTIILFIATSAFLTVVNADRKSRAVRIATDNLNLALEDMQRRIRTGSYYWCGTGGESSLVAVQNCLSGSNTLSFTEQDGSRTTYFVSSGVIKRQTVSGSIDVTSTEISITSLKFIVQGSALGPSGLGADRNQPYVVISIDGAINNAGHPTLNTSFEIQTTVTQRNYDS